MSVYLGTFGEVELQRDFTGSELRSVISAGDVDTGRKHFKFDFKHGQLISGDQIEITSLDDSTLDFIEIDSAAYADTSIKKFVHVDEVDHIKLYDTFANAVNGGTANALTLLAPGSDIPVRVKVESIERRVLAQCTGFEINTERETVDTTALSDEFRNRISTLMSGSGRMSCFWEYTGETQKELPNYLLELQLRTRIGSQFRGRFYLKTSNSGHNPTNDADIATQEVWYEFTGVLTACAVQFAPDNVIQFTADFITTGPIQIRMALAEPDELLLETNVDAVLTEQGTDNIIAQQG